jgi:Protein of unknown function (DUF3150)
MSSLAVLDKTVCLMLRVSLWTGRRRLRAEDLGDAAKDLPPEDLASLGSLKLCNPKRLAVLGAIKRAAERECDRLCVGFLGGYATEERNITGLVAKLQDYKKRFDNEAADFAAGLQAEINKWTALHPTYKSLIEKVHPDAAHVQSRFQFGFQAFRVGPAGNDPHDNVNGGLAEAASGLSGQLFREIEAEAAQAWKTSYEGKAAVGQKALSPLKTILRKLDALSYLDFRCAPIIDQFRKVLGAMPKHGPIEDPHLSALIGLFRIVQSGQTLRSHGAALLENRRTSHSVSDLFAEDVSLEPEGILMEDGQPSPDVPDEKHDDLIPLAPPAHEKSGGIWF